MTNKKNHKTGGSFFRTHGSLSKRKSSRRTPPKKSMSRRTSVKKFEEQLCKDVESCSKDLMEAAQFDVSKLGFIQNMVKKFKGMLNSIFQKAFNIMKAILGLMIVSLPGGEFIKSTGNKIYESFKVTGQAISNFTEKAYNWGREKTMLGMDKLKSFVLNNKKISLAISTIIVIMSTISMCRRFESSLAIDLNKTDLALGQKFNDYVSIFLTGKLKWLEWILNPFIEIVKSLLDGSSEIYIFFRNNLKRICRISEPKKEILIKGTLLYRTQPINCENLKGMYCSDTGKTGIYLSNGKNIPLGMIIEYSKPQFLCTYETTQDLVFFKGKYSFRYSKESHNHVEDEIFPLVDDLFPSKSWCQEKEYFITEEDKDKLKFVQSSKSMISVNEAREFVLKSKNQAEGNFKEVDNFLIDYH